jgi:hypothetical protein
LAAALFLILFDIQAPPSQGQSTFLDLNPYRTPVSPGAPHEDALFLKEVVESLAQELAISPIVPRGEAGFESFDVRIDRNKVIEPDGSWKRDELGRPVFSVTPTIEIKGETYKQLARMYLEWRRSFEFEWIGVARSATEELKPTPLQTIFNEPTLPRSEKVRQTVQFYRFKTLPLVPRPTPNPAYWPISPIIDLPEVLVQVQFNLRGGQVTVLDSESSKVWVLPFPSEVDPRRWIDEYKRAVNKVGKVRAAEQLRQEALRWGLPIAPIEQARRENSPAEKKAGQDSEEKE